MKIDKKEFIKNYPRLDGAVGDELLTEMDNKFTECVDKAIEGMEQHAEFNHLEFDKKDARKKARRYVLAELIEQFNNWGETGDCLPKGIRLGLGSNKFASVIVMEVKE